MYVFETKNHITQEIDSITGKKVSFNTLDQIATIVIKYAAAGKAPTITSISSIGEKGGIESNGEILGKDPTPFDLSTRERAQVIAVVTEDQRTIVGIQVTNKDTGLVVFDKSDYNVMYDGSGSNKSDDSTILQTAPGATNRVASISIKERELENDNSEKFFLQDGAYTIKLYYEQGSEIILSEASKNGPNGTGATFVVNSTPTITEFKQARVTIGQQLYGSFSLISNSGQNLRDINLAITSSPFLTETGDTITKEIDGSQTSILIPEFWTDADGDRIRFGLIPSLENGDSTLSQDTLTQTATLVKSNGASLTINANNGTYIYNAGNRVNKNSTVDQFTVQAYDSRGAKGITNLILEVADIIPGVGIGAEAQNKLEAELIELIIFASMQPAAWLHLHNPFSRVTTMLRRT
jgi:hypothetical protein